MSQLLSAAFAPRAHDRDASLRNRLIAEILFPAIFFAYFFLHFWLTINPLVLYSLNGIGGYSYLFELRWGFLLDTVMSPGGAILYIVGLITHACHEPWLGALIMTCIAVLFYATTRAYIQGSGRAPWFPLPYIPAVFMLLCYNWYEHRCIVTVLAILGALLLGTVYQAFGKRAAALRLTAAAALFALACQGLGSAGSVLFSLLALIFEYARNRRLPLLHAVVFLLCALCLDFIQHRVFNGYAAFDFSRLVKTETIFWPLYLCYPVIMVLLEIEAKIRPYIRQIFHRPPAAQSRAKKSGAADAGRTKKRRLLAPVRQLFLTREVRTSVTGLLLLSLLIGVGEGLHQDYRKDVGRPFVEIY